MRLGYWKTASCDDRGVPVVENCDHSNDPGSAPQESSSPLHRLMQTIVDRKRTLPEGSYTTQLFRAGNERISSKVAEECREMLAAAAQFDKSPDQIDQRSHLVYEAGDLIYHLFVLLGYHEIALTELEDELRRRFGTSGLAEKSARRTP